MDSKKYNNTKLALSIFDTIAGFILIYLFVAFGWSKELEQYLRGYTSSDYLVFILFLVVIGVVGSVIFFPMNFYSSYILEHKYKLSNQNLFKYFLEKAKGLLVSAVIGIPILLLFFWVLREYESNWWLPFAILMFFISVVLSQIFPVFILPLFYKIKPLENESLKSRISELAKNARLKVENVYSFDMSKNTKKANAAFTGLGRTKRIILGDTLLENYSDDEIETVIAHEIGHYKRKHITKNLIIGTLSSFITLFLIAKLYELSLSWFGFESITQISALPLLTLWSLLIGLLTTPLGNILSRKFEYEADRYAIDVTRKPVSFINTLEKLTEQNLGDKEPHPFVEWFFYSHPSINNRISEIKKISDMMNISEGLEPRTGEVT
ncbi:MAG TPA: M48 family metallopeptidase [Ignavibacteriaceae bacterium]|nr:M48 family metallopeptidase [Ignavibacteriaceae bacterium]